jgi:parvulin-like peptidyl-prolyl isomerase
MNETITSLPISQTLNDVQWGLQERLKQFDGLSIPQLLDRLQALKPIARELVIAGLLDSVSFHPDEHPALIQQLWKGLSCEPPSSLDSEEQWLKGAPESSHSALRERYKALKMQKFLERHYGDQLEPYFLQRRADLEQVVYSVIRIESQGIAEELYLSLLDDEHDFGVLAEKYSTGEERYTRGLVGPMVVTQPHPQIRKALSSLKVGELHAPIRLDRWFLLLKLEHRLAARLDEAQRQKLLQEMFEQELDQQLQVQLAELLDTQSEHQEQISGA